MTIAEDFAVQYDRARTIFTTLPGRAVVSPEEPPNGYDGYFDGIVQGVPYIRLSSTYAPPLGVSWRHRYLHETGHILHAQLRNNGLTNLYLYTRFWAWRFKGMAATPPTWQEASATAYQWGPLGEWSHTPAEMWAEAFVAAVDGYVEKDRSADYQIPLDAVAARAFFIGLVREVTPVTYPNVGIQLAKNADDTLFFYQSGANIIVYDGTWTPRGVPIKKWW